MDIKEKQDIQYELLMNCDKIAQENDIQYFLGSGSTLGAVREHGFIPWDGDIDIHLLYDEYRRCEEILSKKESYPCKWVSYRTDKRAPCLMGRIYRADVKFDNLEEYPYLDVFAFSGAPTNVIKQAWVMFWSLQLFRLYWIKKRVYKGHAGRKKSMIGRILQILIFWYPTKISEHYFEKNLTKWPIAESKYVMPLTGLYGVKDVIPKQWFEKAELIKFRDIMVPITANWDEYLRHMYGDDYMIPKQYSRYKDSN